jgi:phenylalanyl-tRNA synthetase alpha chain
VDEESVMSRRFSPNEAHVLRALAQAGAPQLVAEVVATTGLDQSLVSAAALALQEQGLVAVSEEATVEVQLTDEGAAIAQSGQVLIERLIAATLRRVGVPLELPDVAAALGVPAAEVGKALRFALAKGYAQRVGKTLAPAPDADLSAPTADEELLAAARAAIEGRLVLPAAEAADPKKDALLKDLRARGFVKTRERTLRRLALTADGRTVAAEGVAEQREATQLTEQMLLSGEWRDMTFRPYDVGLDVAAVYPARVHPLRRVLEETRRAFLNLGFAEIRGPYVESAFWDFDALFQPQDHPARDMQDTFYCKRPETFALPDEALVDRIRRTHEDGGDTGSTGWGYRWSAPRARQVVLRTHTTAVTVAACHENPQPPQKVFCVGRVFRRETIDYKHLPEFHQVDGIIVDPDASLATLLGLLRAFYAQMGFHEVKFRPDFFPYTEPSVGVFVRMPGRKDWFELGGSGVFRPEVIRPAGVTVPVLAWGLGLERLAMVRYGVQDIRELYISHLDWLKEAALCR